MASEPDRGFVPLQAPAAVQAVALADAQDRLVDAPTAIVLAAALRLTVGGGGSTVTVVDWLALPPAPEHFSVKVVVAVSGDVVKEPFRGEATVFQSPPDAVQLVALEASKCSVTGVPAATVLGLADSWTTGGAAPTVTVTDWLAVPPAPAQDRVYSVVAFRGPMVCEPLVARFPLQPFWPVQLVTCWADHVRTVLAPFSRVVAAAVRMIVGASLFAVTRVLADALPAGPVQVTAKSVVCVMLATWMVPFVGCGPLMPWVPTQLDAASEWTTRDVAEPTGTTLDRGVRDTTGPPPPLDWQAASTKAVSKPRSVRFNRIEFCTRRMIALPHNPILSVRCQPVAIPEHRRRAPAPFSLERRRRL